MATATQVQFRRGTATQVAAFTGAQGETVVDTTNNRLVVQDGATAGGWPLAKLADTFGQRSIGGSGGLPIQAADRKLNVKITSALSITVPAASTRSGIPLTFKNVASSTANVTLNATGSDTFDGAASLTLTPGEAVTLDPYNDGVNNSLGYDLKS
jgi:Major tropism determinant N-terminal domain